MSRRKRLDFNDLHARAIALETTLATTTRGEAAVLAITRVLMDLKHAVEMQTVDEIDARLREAAARVP